jgi:ATP-dependent Zn protease
MIDKEIREVIGTQYSKATEILRAKREILDKASVVLLEKEKIDGKVLKELMGIPEETAQKVESPEE